MTSTPKIAAALALAAAALTLSASQAPPSGGAPHPQLLAEARESLALIAGEVRVPGLSADVRVLRDRWGVPHIYASSTGDLFMAQGYVMAQDRLWQMEIWRRANEGRLAEILGPQALERDRRARHFRYRGPLDDREWTSYHPDTRRILTAYAAGVNAFITERRENLPIEFKVTGVVPEPWTAETLLLRVAAIGDASAELQLARNVVRLGVEEANRQRAPDPWDDLAVPDGLDLRAIDETVTTGGRVGGGAIRPAILEPYRAWISERAGGVGGRGGTANDAGVIPEPGSNNWVISGQLSSTGKPFIVNDPHREVSNPSLRYVVHLEAPGWHVIGAGEPPFVGVAIGHNDRLGWGLTIVGTDQEDVYVERVNPANANEVRWRDGWEPIRTITETIAVKGEARRQVELKFTRHGPVFHEDRARGLVYALRSAILEPGTAPYLGSLRLAQTRDCRAFLEAAMSWKAPTENLICGDVDGNIAWQASALTPNRKGWKGRLPVPGDGRYEWDGFRRDLPRELNPPRGFVATANNNINPQGFAPPVMFKTSTTVPFDRITRLMELLRPGQRYTIEDHRRMQLDAVSLRARAEVPLFRGWTASSPEVERARRTLADWDAALGVGSQAAAIYSAWRTASSATERDLARSASDRKAQHEASLTRALERLTNDLGEDWTTWRWGRLHTRAFPHALIPAFDLPTVERPGGTGTVAADGATYRQILDTADWDRSIATNVPGQSAQPGSPFQDNLLALWATDQYFPLLFSAGRVEAAASHRLVLKR